MKVYACPDEISFQPDYGNYDEAKESARIEQHKADLKAWLIKAGYTGKQTGGIVSFPVADGCAQYMLADGRKSALIHLPYGDAWNYRDAQFIPKKEILKRIDRGNRLNAMFSK